MKLRLLSLMFLFSLLLTNSSAFCITQVPLALVLPEGPNGMDVAGAYQVYFGVRERYRELGIELKLRRFIKTTNDHNQTGIQPFDFGATLTHWQIESSKKRYGRRHWAVYVMLPPIPYADKLWFAGVTPSMCQRGNHNVAIGNAAYLNAAGLDRLPNSQIIMQHELGHILGASHYEEVYNIMSAIANNQFIDIGVYPPWAPISLDQINFCEARQHLALAKDVQGCLLGD